MLKNCYKTITNVTDERKVFFEATTAKEIWSDVVQKDAHTMQNLCKAMSNLVYEVAGPKFLVHSVAKSLYHLVYKRWGHYTDESDYLVSECSGMSASMMAFLQRQYTLAHMGCSVVMAWDEKKEEMVCFRSLDWKGADDIALATKRFSFTNEKNEETAQVAGITGMLGVLTGAKKGFSVAINYAPWKRSAKFKSDPTFLIRQLLEDETIKDYKTAQAKIQSWEIGSPCFISLCGVNKGEACVIELGSRNVHTREIGDENFLIQTNHYDLGSSPFVKHNEKPYSDKAANAMSENQWFNSELLQNSQKREIVIRKALNQTSDLDILDRLINLYKEVPVLNYETAQWTFMTPATGNIDVYACVDK